MSTVGLLGLDLVLSLASIGLWGFAAVRGRLGWALVGTSVLVVRLVVVLLLAGRGWELAADRLAGLPLALS